MAGYFDAPGSGHKITREHAKDRALARAVGPEQADDLALFDGKRNVGYGAARPVPLGYMLCQHNGRHQDSQRSHGLKQSRGHSNSGREARDSDPLTATNFAARSLVIFGR